MAVQTQPRHKKQAFLLSTDKNEQEHLLEIETCMDIRGVMIHSCHGSIDITIGRDCETPTHMIRSSQKM